MLRVIGRYLGRHHVALLALFIALGGTAVAATFINGKQIKPRSLPENRLTPQAAAIFKASDPVAYCQAARSRRGSYPQGPCQSRTEAVADGPFVQGFTIGTDGNPIAAFGGHPITLARCNDPICAGNNEAIREVNGTFCGGGFADFTISADGYPIFAQPNGGCVGEPILNIAACSDPFCDATATTHSFDVLGNGRWSSIAIGRDGNPIVSYYDTPNGDLKVLHCDDHTCDGSGDTITPVDSDPSTDVGQYSSLAIGRNGNPVIAYYDATNADLKVVRCNDRACAGGDETISVVDSVGLVGKFISLAIGTNGNPVVAYYDEGSANLKVARCNDKACAGENEARTPVDTSGDVGRFSSIAIGLDGRPVVAYYDATNADLKLARCNDPACAGRNESLATLDSGGDVGQYASLAIGVDGVPLVGYLDGGGKIKVARASVLP